MKKILTYLIVLFSILMSIASINALESFSLNTNSVTDSVTLGSSSSSTITITNTGDEVLSLSLVDTDLTLGSDTIIMSSSPTSVSNLAVSGTQNIVVSYSPNSVPAGTYSGSLTLTSTTNSSVTQTVSFSVTASAASGALLTISDDDTDDIFEVEGDIDSKESETLTVYNSGSVNLTNVKISFSDLEGKEFGDEIADNDIDFKDNDDKNFDLDVGKNNKIRFEIDIPSSIERDVYEGVMTIESDEASDFEFDVEITVTGGDVEIEFVENALDLRSKIMTVFVEAGEEEDYEFRIENVGDIDVFDIEFEVEDDLEEETSGDTLPVSVITFEENSIDLEDGDEEDIKITIDIPDGTDSGTYFGEIRALDTDGDELDSFTIEIKVVGDVYISNIEYPKNVEPGDNLDLKVSVKNQGSKIQRNMKVTATLFDADLGNSDIVESSSTFILNVNEEATNTLRFKLPDEASDGSHTLEIRVRYGDNEIVELEEVFIDRPTNYIYFDSYGVNPGVAKCQDEVYTFMKVKNLGKYDEDVKFSAEIENQGIIAESSLIELDVDNSLQKNLILDIKALEPGMYTVVFKASFNGQFVKKESEFRVLECSEVNTGLNVKPIEPVNETANETSSNTYTVFGQEVAKTTAYLGAGVGAVFVLIIVSLFFI